MKTVTKFFIPVLIIGIGIVVMLGLLSLKEDKPKKVPQIKTKIVETTTVKLQPIEAEIAAFGRMQKQMEPLWKVKFHLNLPNPFQKGIQS